MKGQNNGRQYAMHWQRDIPHQGSIVKYSCQHFEIAVRISANDHTIIEFQLTRSDGDDVRSLGWWA
ncbi:hypothetical protein, partial [Enterococcus casseliflavus]|uniref:hypothetical protein n=1 Tax=Enterococcus casseliflavus TaxID=37734 RepID=UPI003D0EB19E